MMSGSSGWKYQMWSSPRVTQLSSWLLGVNVAGAWDYIKGCHHIALPRLAAKLSHVVVDVDRLACHLH
jgi:hypothetical protein